MDTLPVPLEIMQSIFTSCLTDTPLHPNEAPILLTRVCREWRRVTLTTPSLWTTLHIPSKTRRGDSGNLPLESWLDLSKSSPIDFDIDFASLRRTSQTTQDFYMKLLCIHASRWHNARFVLCYEVFITMLANWIPSEPLKSLDTLQLCYPPGQLGLPRDHSITHHPEIFAEMLSSSQSLRTLWLDDSYNAADCLGTLQSQSLRDLSIIIDLTLNETDTLTALERCFPLCPNISSFSIGFYAMDLPPITAPPIVLPRMRNLCINTSKVDNVGFVLNKFWTPHLETLDLTISSISRLSTPGGYVPLHDLLASCTPTLQKLTIADDALFYHPPTAPSIAALVNLTSLTLHEIYYPPILVNFFNVMTLRFTPSGQLSSSQNVALQHIALDVQRMTVQDAINVRTETIKESLETFFVAVVDMVLSRYRLPDNATTFGGQSGIRPLEVFEVGDNFVELYRRQYPGQWPEVVQGWEDMKGVVRFPRLDGEEPGEVTCRYVSGLS